MRSVMTHDFAKVPPPQIERSVFDRSSGHKSTLDFGNWVPVFLDEVLPGDTFTLNMSAFARLATPLKPVMDNMFLDVFAFFVPTRLVWDSWQKLCGEQDNPGDSTDFTVPTISLTNVQSESLADYLGIPVGIANPLVVSALPFRGYNMIWNYWVRDQNLQDSVPENKGDGPDNISDYTLLKRGKRHDYFTSALPFPSKGPDTALPLGTQIDLSSTGVPPTFTGGGYTNVTIGTQQGSTNVVFGGVAAGSAASVVFGTETGLKVDLMAGDMATVRALREAFQLARLFERDARGGTRYKEVIFNHFRVVHPDLNWRPEVLATGSFPINIHPIAQTSGTAGAGGYTDTPQGNLAAFGTTSVNGFSFHRSFTEFGFIYIFVSARADLSYQQGVEKLWLRRTRYDHYWPALSHLSEEPVKNVEIYAQGTAADDQVFGYQEKDSSYRYKPSRISGKFRSADPQSLDIWHLAQDFSALPGLSASFITETPPVERISAVPTEPDLLLDCYFKLKCARPMPVYSVPGFIDHF